MSENCSVCLLHSSSGLTSLFVNRGDKWHNNGLSNMLEAVLDRKINDNHKAQLSICNHCIRKLIDNYFNTDENIKKEFHFAGLDSISSLKSSTVSCFKEEGPPIDFINRLDILCLDKIFGYLPPLEIPKMAEVCKKWRGISQNAWHNVKKISDKDIKFGQLEIKVNRILLNCGRYLEELSLGTSFFDTNVIMPILKENCPNLKRLSLALDYIHERDFVGAFENMEKLKFLYMGMDMERPEISARILESVTESLEEIFLSEFYYPESANSYVTLSDLPPVLGRFNRLSQIQINHCLLDNNALAAILQKTTLVDLDLSYCWLGSATSLESNLVNLKKLSLTCSENIEGVLHISSMTSRDLTSLQLDCCVSREFCVDIAKYKNLEYLNLEEVQYFSDSDFIAITRKCKRLKVLNLMGLKNVSSPAFETIGQLRNLEGLHLSNENVDDRVITSIANQCRKLGYLGLNSCDHVTVAALRKLGNLINLESLYLSGGVHVDDTVIMSIANNCSKLESLCIQDAKYVTDSSIIALIKQCPHLGDLNLSHCNITAVSLICAVQETKRRQKQLNFQVHPNKIVKIFNKLDMESPFLTIF